MALTKGSDNRFPKILFAEGAAAATPLAGHQALYVKSSDGLLYVKDDTGAERGLETAGTGLSDHLADATDAHDASAISIVDAGTYFTGTTVEAALQELGAAGGGGSVATDTIWDAAGDLAVGSGANTAARLAAGSEGEVLTIAAGVPSWEAAAGGGATIEYGALKPATPTDDFDGASLGGSWAANSQAGTFATTNCWTQGPPDGSRLHMAYSAQSGSLYLPASNTDLEWIVGGFTADGTMRSGQKFPGIAVLDSSGNGVGLCWNTDGSTYLVEISAYAWSGGNYGTVGGVDGKASTIREWWFRITRSGNTWDGYMSTNGHTWNYHSTATGSKTITVDKVAVGTFKPNDGVAHGLITVDWCDLV